MRSLEMPSRMRSLEMRAIHSKYAINYDMTGAGYTCVKVGERTPSWPRHLLPLANGLLDGSLAGWLVGLLEWTSRCFL
jgi:hypothetical protein